MPFQCRYIRQIPSATRGTGTAWLAKLSDAALSSCSWPHLSSECVGKCITCDLYHVQSCKQQGEQVCSAVRQMNWFSGICFSGFKNHSVKLVGGSNHLPISHNAHCHKTSLLICRDQRIDQTASNHLKPPTQKALNCCTICSMYVIPCSYFFNEILGKIYFQN